MDFIFAILFSKEFIIAIFTFIFSSIFSIWLYKKEEKTFFVDMEEEVKFTLNTKTIGKLVAIQECGQLKLDFKSNIPNISKDDWNNMIKCNPPIPGTDGFLILNALASKKIKNGDDLNFFSDFILKNKAWVKIYIYPANGKVQKKIIYFKI